ncbi:MAG: GtrA family protein, partial [Corynebacterium urealyticum]
MSNERPEQPVTSDARGADGVAAANGAAGVETTANSAAGAEAGAGDVVVKNNIGLNQQIFRFILTGGLSAIVDLGSTLFLRFV